MAVLGSGLMVMVLLSLFGNCGLQQETADDAYAPAAVAVEVRTTKRKVRSRLVVPSLSSWGHAVSENSHYAASAYNRGLGCRRHAKVRTETQMTASCAPG